MNPDELTLKRASKGDAYAFEQIVSACQDRIYSVCLRIMRNEQDALDAAQETFLKIYQNLPSFRGAAGFSTWAYRVAANTCFDMLRRQRGKDAASLDEIMENQPSFDPASGMSAEGEAARAFDAQAVSRAIALLPDDQRAVVVMRDIEAMSYDDIASALSLNLNTVKSRISRGRQNLRKILGCGQELFMFPDV